ncbi:MAG: class I SAM-dependent methyltransferase [Candidatus Dependentiae bacterium]|nr:class I SAM-dependent methyltransferase [Candidatus Dependentiae bacterium]
MKKKSIVMFCFMILHFNFTGTIEFMTSDMLITPGLSSNAIIRAEVGFEKDFLVLHCLIKKYNPKKIFEIGTCEGYGTLIMANACRTSSIISIDLPPNTPPYYLDKNIIGSKCYLPYLQVFGDSLTYNYEQHFPIDAWFIDGAHDYDHVKYETEQAAKSDAQLIIYHDTDVPEVLQAVIDSLEGSEYTIYRVTDTRISYAIK